jgi:predicted peptidase
MGGYGTWHAAMAYPELFAAIAPCCGGGMAWNAEVLNMPIWTFHGLEDTVVSPNQTLEMIESLKDRNPNFKYTLYEGVGHGSWKQAFSEELLQWLLAQHK